MHAKIDANKNRQLSKNIRTSKSWNLENRVKTSEGSSKHKVREVWVQSETLTENRVKIDETSRVSSPGVCQSAPRVIYNSISK